MEVVIRQKQLIGISLDGFTSNEHGKSGVDAGALWQKFHEGNYQAKIPDKLNDEVIAVYFDYQGDHNKPFRYFIGCEVKINSPLPEDLQQLIVPEGIYHHVVAKGKMPDCMADAWKNIWKSPVKRAYSVDFEVYGKRSNDWDNAEVDIYLGLEP